MSRDWDRHFMTVAQLNAQMSTCVTRQVGAVAVLNRRQLAAGFNGNLPGAMHCDEGGCARCNDPDVKSGVGLDRCSCVHAEQALISWCAKFGIRTDGVTVYCTTHPCSDCLKLLISAGVTEIVYADAYIEHGFVEQLKTGVQVRRHSL